MDFPILIQKVWDSPSCVLKVDRWKYLNNDKFISLNIVVILENGADPDKM